MMRLNIPVYAMWHPKEKHVHTYHLENWDVLLPTAYHLLALDVRLWPPQLLNNRSEDELTLETSFDALSSSPPLAKFAQSVS